MAGTGEAKREYDILKESGELSIFLPKCTGDWERDKSLFISLFEENQKIIEDAMNIENLFDKEDF